MRSCWIFQLKVRKMEKKKKKKKKNQQKVATPLLFDRQQHLFSALSWNKISHMKLQSLKMFKTTKDMFYKQFECFANWQGRLWGLVNLVLWSCRKIGIFSIFNSMIFGNSASFYWSYYAQWLDRNPDFIRLGVCSATFSRLWPIRCQYIFLLRLLDLKNTGKSTSDFDIDLFLRWH